MNKKFEQLIDTLILDVQMGNEYCDDGYDGWPESRAKLVEAIDALITSTEKAEAKIVALKERAEKAEKALIKIYTEPVLSKDDLRKLSDFVYGLEDEKK